MVWGRMDDQFESHPKVENLSLEAIGLWSVCWSRALSQVRTAPVLGFVAESYVRQRAGKRAHALVSELIRPLPGKTYGLWEPVDGGWLIHDFEDYLPKRRDPAEAAESGRKGAAKRWPKRGKPIANSYPDSHTRASEQPPDEPSSELPGELDDSYAKNGSHVTRACVPDPVPEPEGGTTGGGDRNVSRRASNATDPPPRCAKHPNGNPTDEPCAGCARLREWDERRAAEARQQAVRARQQCPDCGGSGWAEDDHGNPTRKCEHPRTARAS